MYRVQDAYDFVVMASGIDVSVHTSTSENVLCTIAQHLPLEGCHALLLLADTGALLRLKLWSTCHVDCSNLSTVQSYPVPLLSLLLSSC